jgi:GGDEF domain-containing protein
MAERAGWEVCGKNLLSLSMGAAFYPQHGMDVQQLLAEADKKMYASKKEHYQRRELLSPGEMQHANYATIH